MMFEFEGVFDPNLSFFEEFIAKKFEKANEILRNTPDTVIQPNEKQVVGITLEKIFQRFPELPPPKTVDPGNIQEQLSTETVGNLRFYRAFKQPE